MNEEKRRILEMLEQGILTAEEALSLLEHVEDAPPPPPKPAPEPARAAAAVPAPGARVRRMLRIEVDVKDEDHDTPTRVRVNLPLSVAKLAGSLTHMLPEDAREAIADRGIELDQIDLNEIIDELAEVGGDIVNIQHQDDDEGEMVQVRIYVE